MLVTTTLNPAQTNQTVTFTAFINPVASSAMKPTGLVQFKANGTKKLGSPISLTNGQAKITIVAATLGASNAVISAEYSDSNANFGNSTNRLTEFIISWSTPPKLSLGNMAVNGTMTANLSGAAGVTYIIEASADMVHWAPISTNVADVNGSISLVDTNAHAYISRFYRARTP
jgi:hypothetical protein